MFKLLFSILFGVIVFNVSHIKTIFKRFLSKVDMKILKFEDASYITVNARTKRKLIHTANLMTVIVDFTDGPWSEQDPLHNHPHEQITAIVEGEVIFYLEGEEAQLLKTGDMIAIPPYQKHAIKLISKTARLIDTFTPVREDFLK